MVLRLEHRGAELPVSYLHRDGRGEALLYFHGLGSTKEDFLGAWQVPDWSGHTLVAFDAPACGGSGEYRGSVPLGVDDIVAVAEGLAGTLGLEGVTVIGHSMGGLVGLLFTLRNRELVRRLVSVEGNLVPEDCSIYSRRVFEEPFLGREEAFMEELEEDIRRSGVTGFDRAARTLRQNVDIRGFFDYCRSIVEYSDGFPLLEEFLALDVPRLYIHGAENGHLPQIPRLAESRVAVASIPDSNHFPVWSNPTAFYQALGRFIRETNP